MEHRIASLGCLLLTTVAAAPAPGFEADALLRSADGKVVVEPDQWGLKAVGLDARMLSALSTDQERDSVIVAVIDSGLDLGHPDFSLDNLWFNEGETLNGLDDDGNGYVDDTVGWNFIDQDNNVLDDLGHGTHVSGVIAATTGNGIGVAGIDARARIMVLKALNPVGRGRSTRVAEAIMYAVNQGARVINLSMATPELSVHERSAVEYAVDNNVLVVAAAGNEGKDTSQYSPAGLPGVISVAAVADREGALRRSGFSNWGRQVDVAAPGENILSLRSANSDMNYLLGGDEAQPEVDVQGWDGEYYATTGTSFAAPFVTAAASLLLSVRPGLTADQVRRMLLNAADDVEIPGIDFFTGYGVLNVQRLLEADPGYYVICSIDQLSAVQTGGGTAIRLVGSASADQFKVARISLGKGENPERFMSVEMDFKSPVEQDVLADLPAALFSGSKQWTIRMEVVHERKNAGRECRFNLTLS